MIQFKLDAVLHVGHPEVRVFTRKLPTETWAGIGTLRMTNEDWVAFKGCCPHAIVEERAPGDVLPKQTI